MSRTGRMRPLAHHDLLLRAALHPDPDVAADARRAWAAAVDLDALDFGSVQLLPLLGLRVDDGSLGDPALERQVRHVVRFSWLRTQLMVRQLGPALQALRDAGLQPVVGKGAAAVHAHGVPSRLRPMFDVDVSVAAAEVPRAREALRGAGFVAPLDRVLERRPAEVTRDLHALEFRGPGAVGLDLHWHLLHTARNDAIDDRFRARAVPCQVGDVACLATSLEDTIVLAVAHGTRWAKQAAVRWVGDVVLLLRRHGEALDWDALAATAAEVRLSRAVLDALEYVEDLAGLAAPSPARRLLRRTPVPLAVRARRHRRSDPRDGGPVAPSRLGALLEAYEEDVASTVAPGARTGPADAVRFLARRWALPAGRAVPGHALWVAAGRPWLVRRALPRRVTSSAPLRAPVPYRIGSELRFDVDGDGAAYATAGWWFPEPHGMWTRAHAARIVLPLAEPLGEGAPLRLWLRAPVCAGNPRVRVVVVVNDVPVGRLVLDHDQETVHAYDVRVPRRALRRHQQAEVTLLVERPIAPADSRLSTDLRQIGCGLSALRLGSPDIAPPRWTVIPGSDPRTRPGWPGERVTALD